MGSDTINVPNVVARAKYLISISLRRTNINSAPKSGRKAIRESMGKSKLLYIISSIIMSNYGSTTPIIIKIMTPASIIMA